MIGRGAYDHPWRVLSNADTLIFSEDSNPSLNRRQVHHFSHSFLALFTFSRFWRITLSPVKKYLKNGEKMNVECQV